LAGVVPTGVTLSHVGRGDSQSSKLIGKAYEARTSSSPTDTYSVALCIGDGGHISGKDKRSKSTYPVHWGHEARRYLEGCACDS